MTRDFAGVTTVSALSVVGVANYLLEHNHCDTFVSAYGRFAGHGPQPRPQAKPQGLVGIDAQSGASRSPGPGTGGLLGFGMGFGVLTTFARVLGTKAASRCVSRRAEAGKTAEIAVAEKTKSEIAKIPYLKGMPRTLVTQKTLEKLLSTTPKEQWDNPPEDSYLYVLKCYAETYGPGKATKMGWWDYWFVTIHRVDEDEIYSGEELAEYREYIKEIATGKCPLFIPGPAGWWPTGATIQWRGPEPFAGDQTQTPLTAGLFATQFLDNLAFYRKGLEPWQRGLEIGMAHGYFLIGPFVSLGPLRNTPEAATVGLLAGCAVVGLVSCGGLLFGTTIKPTRFDRPGDLPAAGFQEMINWHAIGGLGGAGFAHALLTVFGP